MEAKKVLVVDDEEIIRDMLQEALNQGGYEVRLAGSAEEGMDILRKESIMVMFLDLNLPGMNGVELCKRIRKKNKLSIIYALTGYSNLFGLIECRDAGFDDFFTKPASIELLLEAAQDAFKKIERWKINDYDLV